MRTGQSPRLAIAVLASTCWPAVAWASPADDATMAAVQQELATLRERQAQQLAALEDTATRLSALEQRVAAMGGSPATPPVATSAGAVPAAVAAPKLAAAPPASRLDVSGDMRVRYEENFGEEGVRNRGRGVVRARVRASYAVNDWLSAGGQIATGDPDDPNSADITLSSFDDDLAVSLDQAWLRAHRGGGDLWAGKFPNPFTRTELVWDGDVSPQGLAATWQGPLASGVQARLAGLYFLIDEDVAGPDSSMVGGQAELILSPAEAWSARLSAGYYDYTVRSIGGADAGDFRSNLRDPAGRYLSDFDILDVIAAVGYSGVGDAWPIRLAGEYVHNFGAVTSANTGYGFEAAVGRTSRPHDLKFGYSYLEAETDAVFAAFSHDNLALGTNYIMHGMSVDYVLAKDLLLNATLYHYRVKDPLGPGGGVAGDWRNRLRLNLMASF